ncbi:hypothetical protein TMS3_0115665 [Pseudomonas taeanensis MS-3]|uniref:Uncharacterized protein n=1 Tax=Pseudomonas taeanensis MS-3 TaxID=1395571 RepID=A0A0A1YIQ0_9PSED|nr:hypothetical protein [Pseudomonas taeanensis]KFX68921.1 hypothetical protein TMS3_0115665 [Pseudomonas taeanensis MS-3]
MNLANVQVEPLLQGGRQLWQVRMGRRALIFQEELAARAFAAQLHMRMTWLRQQNQQDDADSRPS